MQESRPVKSAVSRTRCSQWLHRTTIFGVIGLFVLFLSCNKSGKFSSSIEEGIYYGTLTVEYFGDMPPKSWWRGGSGEMTLELADGRFSCIYSSGIPGGGLGNYSTNDNKIIFNEEHVWTADFDGGLILNGEYNFTFDGKRLKFSKSYDGYSRYKYELTRK